MFLLDDVDGVFGFEAINFYFLDGTCPTKDTIELSLWVVDRNNESPNSNCRITTYTIATDDGFFFHVYSFRGC